MRGTSFQGGFGASEFYSNDGKWNRLKTEFTLVVGAEKSTKDVLTGTDKAKDAFKFYFAVRTDFDMGSGADSVRVGMGLAFLPSAYFGAK